MVADSNRLQRTLEDDDSKACKNNLKLKFKA